MKKCINCGKTHNDSQNFCADCGSRLEAVAETTVQVNQGAAAVAAEQTKASSGFLANNWILFAAIIGYCLSWVSDMAIIGTVVSAGAAALGWVKDPSGYACRNIAARIVATVIGGLSILELFMYGVL